MTDLSEEALRKRAEALCESFKRPRVANALFIVFCFIRDAARKEQKDLLAVTEDDRMEKDKLLTELCHITGAENYIQAVEYARKQADSIRKETTS